MFGGLFKPIRRPGRQVDLNAMCPACGHRGCKIRFIDPPIVPTGDNKGTVTRDVKGAKIERECVTCGAKCYEDPVLDVKKWIG